MKNSEMPAIEFNLSSLSRWDEDAKVWVGYIPALRLCAQAKAENRLEKSLLKTAHSFIVLCWERGILDDVMRERGLRKINEKVAREKTKQSGGQYIIIGNVERDAWNEVPLDLLAGKQAMIECRR